MSVPDHHHKFWHSLVLVSIRAVLGIIWFAAGLGFLATAHFFWYFTPSPIRMIGGIAMLSLGIGAVSISIFDFLEVLTSARTRRGICPFCHPLHFHQIFTPKPLQGFTKKIPDRLSNFSPQDREEPH